MLPRGSIDLIKVLNVLAKVTQITELHEEVQPSPMSRPMSGCYCALGMGWTGVLPPEGPNTVGGTPDTAQAACSRDGAAPKGGTGRAVRRARTDLSRRVSARCSAKAMYPHAPHPAGTTTQKLTMR